MVSNYFPVPNCVQIDMLYHKDANDNVVENVYHVGTTVAADQTFLASLVNVFETWESATMRSQRDTDVALDRIIARDLSSANGQVFTKPENIAGTRAGTHLPAHCSWAIKWSTGKRGRSFRGRTFHIGLGLADLNAADPNTVDATRAAAIVAAYGGLLTSIGTFGASLVVVQRKSAGNWINPPLTHPITAATFTDLNVDSQRRRLPGHNRHR